MSGSRKWYQFTSAELADFIISNYDFPLEEVVDVYTTIVRQTAYSSNDLRSGFDSRENLKELMRYRFLTRLLARVANGAKTINAVYQRLSVVQRIRDNDQFWLQFAMARMEEDDLDTASTYLNTAMGIAEKKGQDYSKRQLTDQRARLRFRKNARSGTVINKKELAEAISDLNGEVVKKTEYLVHPLRSVEHILHFLEMRIDDLDEDVIGLLRSLIKTMREHFPDGKLDKSQRGETEKIRKDLQSSWLILANA